MMRKADKILNATIQLFLRDGIRKTTMDDIAEQADVSKVTIYKYFADKESLYLEVGRRIYARYAEMLASILASGEPLIKKLYSFLDVISDFSDSGNFKLGSELTKYNMEADGVYDRYLQTYQNSLLTLIDDGLGSGLIKGELDRMMVFHYIDMGVSYYQQCESYRDRMRIDLNFRERFLLFYVRAIFNNGPQILSDT
jgi:AcrR family transcriptional regulator